MAEIVVKDWPLDSSQMYFVFTMSNQAFAQINAALAAASAGDQLILENSTTTTRGFIAGVQISSADFVAIVDGTYQLITFEDLWMQNDTSIPYSLTFTK